MERAIRVRKDAPEFSNGGTRILESGNPSVLIHRCEGENSFVIAVHNLSGEECDVTVETEFPESPVILELLSNRLYDALENNHLDVELDGYGYCWFRVTAGK